MGQVVQGRLAAYLELYSILMDVFQVNENLLGEKLLREVRLVRLSWFCDCPLIGPRSGRFYAVNGSSCLFSVYRQATISFPLSGSHESCQMR